MVPCNFFIAYYTKTTIGQLKRHWLFCFCYSIETERFITIIKTADEISAYTIADDLFWLID